MCHWTPWDTTTSPSSLVPDMCLLARWSSRILLQTKRWALLVNISVDTELCTSLIACLLSITLCSSPDTQRHGPNFDQSIVHEAYHHWWTQGIHIILLLSDTHSNYYYSFCTPPVGFWSHWWSFEGLSRIARGHVFNWKQLNLARWSRYILSARPSIKLYLWWVFGGFIN